MSTEERAARIAAAERELSELRARAAEIERRWARLVAMAGELVPLEASR